MIMSVVGGTMYTLELGPRAVNVVNDLERKTLHDALMESITHSLMVNVSTGAAVLIDEGSTVVFVERIPVELKHGTVDVYVGVDTSGRKFIDWGFDIGGHCVWKKV